MNKIVSVEYQELSNFFNIVSNIAQDEKLWCMGYNNYRYIWNTFIHWKTIGIKFLYKKKNRYGPYAP